MRAFLAACIAPCASPLLTAAYAWLILHVGTQGYELARWVRFDDLWPLFLGEYVLVLVVTWCAGYPIYAMARSKRAASGVGRCIAGAVTGTLLCFLLAMIASLASTLSWGVLIIAVIGGLKGAAIAAAFSRLAGIPPVASHSTLLQRGTTSSEA